MVKKLNLIIIFLILLCFNFRVKALNINSRYAIIYNLTDDEVIYQKDINRQIPIASLTKMMTAIIAIERFNDLNAYVMIPYGTQYGLAEEEAARVGFTEGSWVTYNDLLHGALLPSGADATRAISIIISGSESNFAGLMNQKAKELGMNNTHFVNSSGLDAYGHYSTVSDLLILLKYVLKNERFKKIYETKTYTSSQNIYMESTVIQASKWSGVNVSNIKGSKTGFTYDAGYCLASEFVLNDTTFLSVTAGSDLNGLPQHIIDANTIYDYLKSSYSVREILSPNTLALTLKPEYAKEEEINFFTDKSITKYIKNDEDIKLDYVYNGVEYLLGNETKGTHLGSVDIIYKGKVIDTVDISLNDDLTFDWQRYYKNYLFLIAIVGWLVGLSIIVFIFVFILKRRLRKA